MNKIQKKILILAVSIALSVCAVTDAVAAATVFPFTGASSAPSQDVIAKDLSTITTQNTTGTVSTIEQVAPSDSSTATAPADSASFGVVTAFSNPNMSQDTPNSSPPPAAKNCNPQCGTECSVGGAPTWSGFDSTGWTIPPAPKSYPACPAPAHHQEPPTPAQVSPKGPKVCASYIRGRPRLFPCSECAGTYSPGGGCPEGKRVTNLHVPGGR